MGGQGGDDQRRAGPQVAGLDRRAGKMIHALHHGGLFIHLDVGAHALELVYITVAVIPHALRHQRSSFRKREDRGDLRLHVSGEAGIGQGLDIGPVQGAGPADQEGVLVLFHVHAHFHQFGGDAVHVLGNNILHQDLSTGGSHGGHISARLDLVRNDGIIAAPKAIHATDLDGICAGATDVGTHGVKEIGQVHDVGFLGRIFDNSSALRPDGGHHNVHGGAHGDHVQVDIGPFQQAVFRGGIDEATFHHYLSAQSGEALDVLVDGTDAEIASAGHGHLRLPKAP